MAQPAGSRIGPFEIVSLLGAGGMGEVYRARDTKLNRDVAIKVLPDLFANDPDRLARFTREAQTLASLNHPNIAHIHGFEEAGGARALVMELVEADDLSALIARGPMPLADALPIARQIADALEAAHEQGIIHRDLKPANVKVRADGTVKVLDFGLAKALDPATSSSADAMNSPTLTAHATQMGMILGTAAYMAPEQARGKAVDRRADIWAFGVVLYEMLSGRRAFEGDDVSITLASVLKEDVKWEALPANLPPPLRRLLRRCLEKDPKRRLSAIGDARLELDEAAAGAAEDPAALSARTAAVVSPRRRRTRLALLVAGGLAIAALGAAASYFARPAPDLRLTRFAVLPPDKASFGETMAISPDGHHLAFVARADGTSRIWVRPLDTLVARPLPGTEGADFSVFWSPDNAFLGFFADGKLKKVPVAGGPVQTVCDAAAGSGGTWGHDGVIVFAGGANDGLSRVSAAGGKPAVLTALDSSRQEASHRWPAFLPDGRHLLYVARSVQTDNHAIFATSVDNPAQRTLLVPAASNALYAPPGFLLLVTDGTLMAQPFDAKTLKLTGDAFPIAEGVGTSATRIMLGTFSVSNNGVLVYGGGTTSNRQFAWFDRSGKELSRIAPVGRFVEVALSPDGGRAAFRQVSGTNADIWILDLARGVPSRLTFDPASEGFPVWSPDGVHVAFLSSRTGVSNLYQKLASGAGADELMLKSGYPTFPTDWSHDGRFVLFHENHPQTKSDIYALPLFGDRKPVVFLQTEFIEMGGRFSPDDRWIAYASDESGRQEVYVQSFPASGGKAQISTGGGGYPRWRKDGKELFYLTPDRMLMAVPIKNGTAQGVPTPLFEAQVEAATGFIRYDVTSDGQRILRNVSVSATVTTPLTVVMNWTTAIRK